MKKFNHRLCALITILNDGEWHDGNQLGATLGLSRSAIWKMVEKLKHYQIPIVTQKAQGYRLQGPLILLSEKKIKSHLLNQNLDVMVLESIHSTNDYLRLYAEKFQMPVACLAEHQSQGKGRWQQRSWHSPFGQNIYFSYAYPLMKDISAIAGFSLMVSLAVRQTISHYVFEEHLKVKWPNDVLYLQKKLAGILIEIQAESNGLSHIIIGIGINVNLLNFGDLAEKATSIREITRVYNDRNELVARLVQQLQRYLERFERQGFTDFIEEWQQHDYLANKTITVQGFNKKIQGKMLGIDAQGHLLLQNKDKVDMISAGEASVAQT